LRLRPVIILGRNKRLLHTLEGKFMFRKTCGASVHRSTRVLNIFFQHPGSTARIVVLLFAILGAATAHAQYYGGDYPHMWGGGWGWGGMILGPLIMILFVAATIAVVVLLVRWIGGGSTPSVPPPATGKSALDILKERFARGEIDKEEFEERKRLLSD
jgi:putative membrane protein